MTSWTFVASLSLLVSLIDLSKEHCLDHFEMTTWDAKNLTQNFTIVNGTDARDLIECTLRNAIEKRKTKPELQIPVLQDILGDCIIEPRDNPRNVTCEGESSQNVSFYHLMCLTAKALDHLPEACNYGTVCKLYSEVKSIPLGETTTLSAPTTAPTTLSPTTLSPTTTPQETTTVLPPTTETPKALSLTTTALPPTSTVTQSKISDVNAVSRSSSNQIKNQTDASHLKSFLVISMTLNLVLPLTVYLLMRRRKQDRTLRDEPQMETAAQPTPAVVFQKLVSGSQDDKETTELMQPEECPSIIAPYSEPTRNG